MSHTLRFGFVARALALACVCLGFARLVESAPDEGSPLSLISSDALLVAQVRGFERVANKLKSLDGGAQAGDQALVQFLLEGARAVFDPGAALGDVDPMGLTAIALLVPSGVRLQDFERVLVARAAEPELAARKLNLRDGEPRLHAYGRDGFLVVSKHSPSVRDVEARKPGLEQELPPEMAQTFLTADLALYINVHRLLSSENLAEIEQRLGKAFKLPQGLRNVRAAALAVSVRDGGLLVRVEAELVEMSPPIAAHDLKPCGLTVLPAGLGFYLESVPKSADAETTGERRLAGKDFGASISVTTAPEPHRLTAAKLKDHGDGSAQTEKACEGIALHAQARTGSDEDRNRLPEFLQNNVLPPLDATLVKIAGELARTTSSAWFGHTQKEHITVAAATWADAEPILSQFLLGKRTLAQDPAWLEAERQLPRQASGYGFASTGAAVELLRRLAPGDDSPARPRDPSYFGAALTLAPKQFAADVWLPWRGLRELEPMFERLQPLLKRKTASVRGRVLLHGSPPKPIEVDLSLKPECVQANGGPTSEVAVLEGAQGGLKDAFVYVKAGLGPQKFSPPSEPAVLTWRKCQLVPRILVVRVLQDLRVVNEDPFAHSPNLWTANFPGSQALQAATEATFRSFFKKPNVQLARGCDIHAWESVKICVIEHPFWHLTGLDGSFEIRGLSPGTYTLETWHEVVQGLKKPEPIEVTLTAGETRTLDFVFVYEP